MNQPALASRALSLLAGVGLMAACSKPSDSTTTPPATSNPAISATTPSASASAAPAASAADPQKEEERKKLEVDKTKLAASHKAEMERWTPALHAEAKALAERSFPDTRSALQAILTSKHRRPGNADRDRFRHPAETLAFMGLKPTMTVFEYGPGEGWYTELLAPLLAPKGKLIVNMGDPDGPPDQRPTFYAQRTRLFLSVSPELFGKVQAVITGAAPRIADEGTVDLVLVNRGLHGMHNNKTMATWLTEIHRILKPGGVLGIEQHRAAEGANPDETSKKGYLPEKWVIAQIEAAGFKLAATSEINANPKDTKNYPEGVWVLPPTLQLGDKDREKYTAIGESDRMTLRFTRAAQAAPARSK